jgi:hypothetical protein
LLDKCKNLQSLPFSQKVYLKYVRHTSGIIPIGCKLGQSKPYSHFFKKNFPHIFGIDFSGLDENFDNAIYSYSLFWLNFYH